MRYRWLATMACAFFLLAGPAGAAVEANHATALDLESIKGIGPSTAGKILAQRQIRRFSSWQDFIERVPGVGARRAARMSDSGLTVNGQHLGPAKPAAMAPRHDTPRLPPQEPFPAGSVIVEWPLRRP
ncbi:MAG: helix-hairpin-helix domain-containing protein [Hydrogenophaga sp.]|uniref:ComEA family DNA-binding protein n=1 Tax=Hydrogenophaga sp. TaxID=1904254 RepID=UPI0026028E24|nr:helix-hairpin-helix domain-containing protein [Hydrogenophaga sp.]MDD3784254.1 helix-hairpin-helix domain-containing protein [Hydrogenophaga sp.]